MNTNSMMDLNEQEGFEYKVIDFVAKTSNNINEAILLFAKISKYDQCIPLYIEYLWESFTEKQKALVVSTVAEFMNMIVVYHECLDELEEE